MMEEIVKDICKYLKRVARKRINGDDICGAKEEIADDMLTDWMDIFDCDFEERDLFES